MVLLKECVAPGFGSVATFSFNVSAPGRDVGLCRFKSGHPRSLPGRRTCEARGGRAPWAASALQAWAPDTGWVGGRHLVQHTGWGVTVLRGAFGH